MLALERQQQQTKTERKIELKKKINRAVISRQDSSVDAITSENLMPNSVSTWFQGTSLQGVYYKGKMEQTDILCLPIIRGTEQDTILSDTPAKNA